MEERIRSTRSSLAVFVGCCAMSFIGFALITNTSGLYFDAISRDLHVGRAKVSLTVSIRLICSAISMAAFSRFSHRIRLRPPHLSAALVSAPWDSCFAVGRMPSGSSISHSL